MITENLPILAPEMNLGEAIILVSKGKLGLGVAIEQNHIAGIITDGDIRRAMELWKADFFNRCVKDIMTKTPKTVSPQTLTGMHVYCNRKLKTGYERTEENTIDADACTPTGCCRRLSV